MKYPVEIAHEMFAWREEKMAAAEKMAARQAVEKPRSGKVKKRLSHPAWKSRKPPRDSHFPTASATAGY